jgi:hypothetical protein
MPFLTIREVMRKVEAFHEDFGRRLHDAEEAAADREAKMMLRFLGNHQQQLAEIIASVDQDREYEVATLKEWVQFDTEVEDPIVYLERFRVDPDASAAEVLKAANKLDLCLFCLYRSLAKGGSTPQAQRLFARLARMELEHQKARQSSSGYY